METLNQQIERLQNELETIESKDHKTAADIERREQINWELTKLEGEMQSQQQIEHNHEQRVQTAKDEFSTYIAASLDEDGITPREIFIGESQEKLYTIKSSQAFNALVSKLSSQLSGAEEREIQLKRQNDELQDRFEALEAELRLAQSKASKAEFERDEAHKVRDNAAASLEEKDKEINRLSEQVDELRKEMAVGARNAFKVVDAEEQRKQVDDLVRQVKESRIRVVNMRPMEGDFKRQNWIAEDAMTGDLYSFNWMDKGKYVELNDHEVQQFRLEQAQKAAANATISLDYPITPELQVITEQQFPSSNGSLDQAATCTPDGRGTEGDTEGVTDDASVSLAARVEALEARVAQLEHQRTNAA